MILINTMTGSPINTMTRSPTMKYDTQFNCNTKTFRSDNAKELTLTDFLMKKEFCTNPRVWIDLNRIL